MKKTTLFGMMALLLSTLILFESCSSGSDEDSNTGNSEIPYANKDKKLQRIVCNVAHEPPYEEIGYLTFEYDNDVLTNIHSIWHSFDERGNRYVDENESITFIRADVAIIMWNNKMHSKQVANLVNGRAADLTKHNCIFHYDDKGRLTEVESGWEGLLKLTWDGNNIKRLDYGYGSEKYSIEYTYTKYEARQLQYYFVFNPLGDNDFLDCLDEGALFYTGACGPLSENLPSQVVYKKNGVVFYTNSFQYIVDSSGYPIDALLSTDRDDMVRQWGAGLHGTMHLKITWE